MSVQLTYLYNKKLAKVAVPKFKKEFKGSVVCENNCL